MEKNMENEMETGIILGFRVPSDYAGLFVLKARGIGYRMTVPAALKFAMPLGNQGFMA